MPLDDEAPQFFCSGIQSVAQDGPNTVLSFAFGIPSAPDPVNRTYRTNVRIVMSRDALMNMVDFLQKAMSQPSGPESIPHPMPERPQ